MHNKRGAHECMDAKDTPNIHAASSLKHGYNFIYMHLMHTDTYAAAHLV
jgi:hypothetical protein